jgi:formylglycine-generating enzyme required for sulfatase activity
MAMVKDMTPNTLSPIVVRVMGVVLIISGLSLPWIWLKQYRPSGVSVERIGALRPAMRRLPPGVFLMGSAESEEGRFSNEKQHEVEIKTVFAISVTEVTQGQYEQVMGSNPSVIKGDSERPVENVTFFDAVSYCNKLSEKEKLLPCYRIDGEEVTWMDGLRCRGYRLPTEAEWEYAARADGKTKYAGSDALDDVGWWSGNVSNTTHPVGSKRGNAWGLHDFSGNVWEWVWDRYEGDYEKLPRVDPTGSESGSDRVSRGGSWGDGAQLVRVVTRIGVDPGIRQAYQGFRLARSYP